MRVFSIDLERCPRCPLGALRIVAAITFRPIMHRLLRPLQLAAPTPADHTGARGAKTFRLGLCLKRLLGQGGWGPGPAPGASGEAATTPPSAATGVAEGRPEPQRSRFAGTPGAAPA